MAGGGGGVRDNDERWDAENRKRGRAEITSQLGSFQPHITIHLILQQRLHPASE